MSVHGLRDVVRRLSPPWKREGFYEKVDYSVAGVIDTILEKIDQSIAARIPTRTKTETSLPLVGSDRLIPKGFLEAWTSYAERLRRAFDDWFHAGSARAVLAQSLGFVLPYAPRILGVTNTSVWDYLATGSAPTVVPTHLLASPANWTWDTVLGYWDLWNWRSWLVVDSVAPNAWATSTKKFGDGHKWGDATVSWGFEQPSSVFRSLRSIVGLWKAGRASVQWIVVNFEAGKYDPTKPPGDASLPDGQWHSWSKIVGTTRVASRFSTSRFVGGVT